MAFFLQFMKHFETFRSFYATEMDEFPFGVTPSLLMNKIENTTHLLHTNLYIFFSYSLVLILFIFCSCTYSNGGQPMTYYSMFHSIN